MEKWHVNVSHLHLVDFRLFKNLEVNLDGRLCVFLGDNGSGKTSVIEGLSILLSRIFPYCGFAPHLESLPYRGDLVREWGSILNGRYKQERAARSYAAGCFVGKKALGEGSWKHSMFHFLTSEEDKGEPSPYSMIAADINNWKEAGIGVPVFARYGALRVSQPKVSEAEESGALDYTNPFAAYVNALQPSVDFEAFMDWFYEEETNELREQRRDRSYVSPEMSAVRDALERVFAASRMRVSNPRFEANPKRFVMSCTGDDGAEVELVFDQLSDGYRRMVALVADFARRLAIANRYAGGNPLDGPGVLMIDEVDAHLHPKWQYRVIGDLQRTFPNVQLIVTTHSAEVVSTVDKKHVYILEPEDGVVHEKHPEQQTQGSYPEMIAGPVMGAPSVVPRHPAYLAYLECLVAIQEDAVDTQAYQEAYQKMVDHYGENHAFVVEVHNRLQGLARRRALREKLAKFK